MSRGPERHPWMWTQAFDLLAQAERMQRQFFRLSAEPSARAVWEPPADVFEDEHEIYVVVALPGVAAEGVELRTEPGALVVRAQRPQPFSGARRAVRQLEIPYGCFERRIALPRVPLQLTAHEMSHGCLILRLTKTG